ncbi:MAG: hypothetical protein LBJ35_04690 [Spirochaetaceae bacterium]|jgi:uncharacterized membrane protein|nr:hypothetical protein [Spirochaetaceae bacterium]
MDKIWPVFWKFFLIVIVAAVIVSIILGIERQSSALAADLLQKTMVIAMGICGVIGIAVVPVELYFTDRANRAKNEKLGRVLGAGNENASI